MAQTLSSTPAGSGRILLMEDYDPTLVPEVVFVRQGNKVLFTRGKPNQLSESKLDEGVEIVESIGQLQLTEREINGRTIKTVKDGQWVVEGPYQRSDTKNANNRYYARALWERLIADPNSTVMQTVKSRAMLGHLEHPSDGRGHLKEGGLLTTSLTLRPDGVVWGRSELLDTPSGLILQEYCAKNVRWGVSSRGAGSVLADGAVSEKDYNLSSFDAVSAPSTPGAYPVPVTNDTSESVVGEGEADGRIPHTSAWGKPESGLLAHKTTHGTYHISTAMSPSNHAIGQQVHYRGNDGSHKDLGVHKDSDAALATVRAHHAGVVGEAVDVSEARYLRPTGVVAEPKLMFAHPMGVTTSGQIIPPLHHRAYTSRHKFSKISIPITASHYPDAGAQILKRELPYFTRQDHKDAAAAHRRAADAADHEWGQVQHAAHMQTFGKPPEFHDYRISGVGRDEYSNEHKAKLRDLAVARTEHQGLAHAHDAATRLHLPESEVPMGDTGPNESGYDNVLAEAGMLHGWHKPIPKSHSVQPLKAGENPKGKKTCGHCGLSWDDDKVTGITPAPSGRCPFEYFHKYTGEKADEGSFQAVAHSHQKKIALSTLRMHDAMVGVMGGMNKEEARKHLKQVHGWSDDKIRKYEGGTTEEVAAMLQGEHTNKPIESGLTGPLTEAARAYVAECRASVDAPLSETDDRVAFAKSLLALMGRGDALFSSGALPPSMALDVGGWLRAKLQEALADAPADFRLDESTGAADPDMRAAAFRRVVVGLQDKVTERDSALSELQVELDATRTRVNEQSVPAEAGERLRDVREQRDTALSLAEKLRSDLQDAAARVQAAESQLATARTLLAEKSEITVVNPRQQQVAALIKDSPVLEEFKETLERATTDAEMNKLAQRLAQPSAHRSLPRPRFLPLHESEGVALKSEADVGSGHTGGGNSVPGARTAAAAVRQLAPRP